MQHKALYVQMSNVLWSIQLWKKEKPKHLLKIDMFDVWIKLDIICELLTQDTDVHIEF